MITNKFLVYHVDHNVTGGKWGSPHTTWLRAIDTDVQSVNIGIHSAWRKASDRILWRHIVDIATFHRGAQSTFLKKHIFKENAVTQETVLKH